MSARILSYGGLAYLDIIKNKKNALPIRKLPPVLPFVFYTGSSPWSGPLQFRDCLSESIPPALMEYQFNSKYFVLDIGHLPLEKLNFSEDNLVLSLVHLERAQNIIEVNKVITNAYERLKGRSDSLRRAFMQYAYRAARIQDKHPTANMDKLSEVSMLYERAAQMWEEFAQENQKQGRQELTNEVLLKALKKSYPQQSLDVLKNRLEQATAAQLSQWLDKLELTEVID